MSFQEIKVDVNIKVLNLAAQFLKDSDCFDMPLI